MSLKVMENIENKLEVKKPKLYKVVIYNDDYTTMDFVVEILMKIFRKEELEATKIMYDVHRKGIGVAGVYPYDIAATKMIQATGMAKNSGFPLKFSMEEE
ncbi:ATP-dependent Clp protease adaptor protein ClpS [Clostridium algifaecis]|uniref:ATP-dependent Clp protease adapter protein ClpS n=1 Tax=Clostridium algifaecis TaxID=1472040 RepID=A0ABS4KR76_9CLOT|nr:ATP-dependent Clp protease adaptor ClpS [Clostridium algifaecis]MBP2031896.1 ATP-dependent Clp protease adaptor protein ClpS [Clostridium algifaecis]